MIAVNRQRLTANDSASFTRRLATNRRQSIHRSRVGRPIATAPRQQDSASSNRSSRRNTSPRLQTRLPDWDRFVVPGENSPRPRSVQPAPHERTQSAKASGSSGRRSRPSGKCKGVVETPAACTVRKASLKVPNTAGDRAEAQHDKTPPLRQYFPCSRYTLPRLFSAFRFPGLSLAASLE